MEPLLFSFKRTFHKSIAFGKTLLRDYALTPSRFDMLHAIFLNRYTPILQSNLRRILGVSAPTVSRMLDALEALGHVLRIVPTDGSDRRQRYIALTDQGRDQICSAMRKMFDGQFALRAVNTLLFAPTWPTDQPEFSFAWRLFDSKLWGIRRILGDTSELRYPGPDFPYAPHEQARGAPMFV